MFFPQNSILSNWGYRLDDRSGKKFWLRQKCPWRQHSREKVVVLFGRILFQFSDCVLVSIFCHHAVYLWLLLENLLFQKLWLINCLVGKSVFRYFLLSQPPEQTIFYKNCSFKSLVGPSETGKSQFIYNWLKIRNFHPNLTKLSFYINTPSDFLISWKKRLKISSLLKV